MTAERKQQLILFDCDGTLTDSHAAIVQSMQQAFQQASLEAPQDSAIRPLIGLSLHQVIEQLATEQTELTHDDVHELAEFYRSAYHELEENIELFPNAKHTLRTLQERGYWLGVVTGKSKPGLLRALEKFALQEHFLTIRTGDCCRSKPHPQMVAESMHELGVAATETSVIGDSRYDMQMAKNAAVRAIGVSYGNDDAPTLQQAGAEVVIDRLIDVLKVF